jgi:leucyl/phenylalanyl-tRNA--protein transferase
MSNRAKPAKITAEMLLRAYAIGIFPMAEARNDPELYWIDPEARGVIPLDSFHVSHSLRKTIRHGPFIVTCDTRFEEVIEACAAPAPGRRQTWINQTIFDLCCQLFRMGHSHSVETWLDGKLVGGLYGISLGGAFFGESMFSTATDASKVALVHLVARLRQGNFGLLDTQFVTKHLSGFGALEIPREDYRKRLTAALARQAEFAVEVDAETMEALVGKKSD